MGRKSSISVVGQKETDMRKSPRFRLVVIFLVLYAGEFSGPGWIKAQDLTSEPGYVDLTNMNDLLGQEPEKEINIHGAMLRLVTAAARRDDPELAELLTTVRGIYVRSFDLRNLNFDDVSGHVSSLGNNLEETGWDAFLKVRERDEHVQMYVRIVDDEIAGVVLMTVDRYKDETVFLNIVGEVDPDQLSRISDTFNTGS